MIRTRRTQSQSLSDIDQRKEKSGAERSPRWNVRLPAAIPIIAVPVATVPIVAVTVASLADLAAAFAQLTLIFPAIARIAQLAGTFTPFALDPVIVAITITLAIAVAATA